jgi:hypothetical protein
MRLKASESFRGVALFAPDPELENNPGYYEYYDHYDNQGNTYVPCSGEDCPFCAANDNPSTRALTAWYFPEADVKDRIKLFTMNYSTIEDVTDESEEEDGVLGKKIRIKRLDDRGSYKVKTLPDKAITATLRKELLAQLEKEILGGKGMEGLVLGQLKRQLERLKAIDALEEDDDDDDDEEKTTKATKKNRRGRKAEEEAEEEAKEVEDIEDEEVELLSVSKKSNSVKFEHDGEEIEATGDDDTSVEDFKKGQAVTVSAEYDEDDESWTLTSS